ncbi:glycosyltransferase family 2 protein [Hydromonas duriensis]|uniref:Glycosyltransferase involved in cell wall biosynthesis n=1 Tax=Hydromonas duriensis TaxID=1527608 RepID=A0A4V3DJK1_9BURK|nr:glycosyltransferase family 2 protein [Hydromonas duriensis]TDR30387.1 glycosyltransferase involved in cell wall biosynthesis [Hydromonas duriensis]
MNTLTIAILTQNEARKIGKCLASAAFADQVIVMDSGSTDQTVLIAKAAGAETYIESDWQGFAVQRNRILPHVTSDYIFFLDADEEITPQLRDEILSQVQSSADAIWEVFWEQFAFGRSLRPMNNNKSGGVQRMFKTASLSHFEGVVHEGAVMNSKNLSVKPLRSYLLHYSRDNIYDAILKLAQYSRLGAFKRQQKGKVGGIWRGFASAFALFFRLYVLRRGFLCGGAGFLYSFFVALECFFRYAMIKYDADSLSQFVKR